MVKKHVLSLITIAFFAALLAAGLFLHDDYGGFTDEMMEIETAGINVKYVQSRLFPQMELPDVPTFHWDDLPDLPDYEDKTYGTAVMIPTLFVNSLPGIDLNRAQFLNFRRFYTFLNFWLALISFFFMIRMRFRKPCVALAAVLLMAFSPRFLAESFYNVKDIIFFSWFLVSLSGISWFLLCRNKWGLLIFCLAFALAANTRNYGAALWPAFVFLALIDCLTQEKKPGFSRQILIPYLSAIILSLLLYFLMTPSLWENTFANLRGGLLFSADQVGIGDAELFMGKLVAPKDYWYYLPVWIVITTPILVLLFFLVGVFFILRAFRKSHFLLSGNNETLLDCFILALFTAFLLGIILIHATIYHGWRQCYFLYGPLSYVAVCGLAGLAAIPSRYHLLQIGLIAGCLLSVCLNGLWTLQNHPFDFCYFNWIGRQFATQFSRDYWGVSSKKCVVDLAGLYDGRELVLGVNPDETWGSTLFSLWRLPDELQSRFRPVWKDKNADYLCFCYKHTAGNDHQIDGFELIRSYRIDNYDVAGLYQRVMRH